MNNKQKKWQLPFFCCRQKSVKKSRCFFSKMIYFYKIRHMVMLEILMSIWIAILLGVVQGLTEFLPVSSSGHLILFEKLFGADPTQCILFDVVLHLGTVLAVVIVFWKSIVQMVKHPFGEDMQKLVFATLPTIIIALVFKDFFKGTFDGGLLWLGFLVTAIFMFVTDYACKHNYQYKPLTHKNAIIMGVFQGFAILPGISRSGSTISSALVQGVRRDQSSKFSFLMSIPAILGSLVVELFDTTKSTISIGFLPLIFGFFASAIFGYLAIKLMLKVIKKAKFLWFGIYLVILSAVTFFLL